MNGRRPARAIVLAAGMSRRLGPAGTLRPKCLQEIAGRSLLDRQLHTLRACGVEDVTCVIGHRGEQLEALGVPTIANPRYETTNMVSSLLCARDLLSGDADVIVAYGDIVYEPRVLRSLLETDGEVVVCVDKGWRKLWGARMEDVLSDAETLRVGPDGRLEALGGRPETEDEIEGQYIGLTRLAAMALPAVLSAYDELADSGELDAAGLDGLYMTDLLQRLIDGGFDVRPAWTDHGWLEVDRPEDLATYRAMADRGTLSELYDPDA